METTNRIKCEEKHPEFGTKCVYYHHVIPHGWLWYHSDGQETWETKQIFKTDFQMVQEFIKEKGASHEPQLWMRLINEEYGELLNGWIKLDGVEILDAICDLKYVLNGLANSLGFRLDEAFAEVHRSNMTKTAGNTREDGKIMKGDNYEAPILAPYLSR